jgi:hypothetical protein
MRSAPQTGTNPAWQGKTRDLIVYAMKYRLAGHAGLIEEHASSALSRFFLR